MKAMSKRQSNTLVTVLPMMVLAADGEISEYAAREAGAHLSSLRALVSKGVLVARHGDFVMPAGPYAGQTLANQTFYSVAE